MTNIEDLGSSIAAGSMSAVSAKTPEDISSFLHSQDPWRNLGTSLTRLTDQEVGKPPKFSSSPVLGKEKKGGFKESEVSEIERLEMSGCEKTARRKISVFQRSFDIDTVFEVQDGGGIAESHTLSERACVTDKLSDNCPSNVLIDDDADRIDGVDRTDGIDRIDRTDGIDRIDRTYGIDKIDRIDRIDGIEDVEGYRVTADISQSSEGSCSPSPVKLSTWRKEEENSKNNRASGDFRIVLAPAKLNFSGSKGQFSTSKGSEGSLEAEVVEGSDVTEGIEVGLEAGEIIGRNTATQGNPSTHDCGRFAADVRATGDGKTSVTHAMSSGEDSSDDSDSDSPEAGKFDGTRNEASRHYWGNPNYGCVATKREFKSSRETSDEVRIFICFFFSVRVFVGERE